MKKKSKMNNQIKENELIKKVNMTEKFSLILTNIEIIKIQQFSVIITVIELRKFKTSICSNRRLSK